MSTAAKRSRPRIVAHRGYAARYPENTLESLRGAMRAGARDVEFDVQLTAGGVPVLAHDADLRRVAGRAEAVADLSLEALRGIELHDPRDPRPARAAARVPTLAEAVALLEGWPAVHAFVEIKPAALRRFGAAPVVDAVLEALAPVLDRAAVISFDRAAVERARRGGAPEVGWVLKACDGDARAAAEAMDPDYLVCNRRRLPPGSGMLWPGRWRWMVYEVSGAAEARRLVARGVGFIETMAVGALLEAFAPGPAAPGERR